MQTASSRKKGSRGTFCCRRATCRATSTAGKVWWSSHGALERDRAAHAAPPGSSTDGDSGRLAPQEGIAWDFLASLGEMPGDVDGRECRPPRPVRRDRAGFVVFAGRYAGRRRRPRRYFESKDSCSHHGSSTQEDETTQSRHQTPCKKPASSGARTPEAALAPSKD